MNNDSFLTCKGIKYVTPFIAITLCFALWGYANNITNPMINALSKIFLLSKGQSSWINIAFFTGYLALALPAAMVTERFSFKSGVLVGLALYGIGALLVFPSKMSGLYIPFVIAYFVMTCGLSFLETSCNPYIYAMGSHETAIQRLNLAQAFNPIGSMLGLFIAMNYVSSRISPLTIEARKLMHGPQFEFVKNNDITAVVRPYIPLFIAIAAMFLLLLFLKIPRECETYAGKNVRHALGNLFGNANYREGVITEFFYEGAQVMCWTFMIPYAINIFTNEGMNASWAFIVASKYNIMAIAFFCAARFITTWLMNFIRPGVLMLLASLAAIIFLFGAIFLQDRNGIYCLVLVSACMSLMFPTIYGIAFREIGSNIKFGGAGLIMAIFGGLVLPPLQDVIIGNKTAIMGLPSINVSFFVPMICFLVVAIYSVRAFRRNKTDVPQ
jgi:FHS family L-fucose permease-like MFS transporter